MKSFYFLTFLIKIQKLRFFIFLLGDILTFSFSLYFIIIINLIINGNPENLLKNFTILGVVLIVKFCISIIRLKYDIQTRKELLKTVMKLISISSYKAENNHILSRIISREINYLLEFVSNSSKIFYYPIALVIGIITVYKIKGYFVTASCITIFLLSLLSYLIAKKSIVLASKIFSVSQERINNANLFLSYRPYLKNWNELKKIITINELTDKEISLRNRDSLWRSLDLYLIVFSGAFSVVVILTYDYLFNKNSSEDLTVLLWLLPIILALILEIARFFSDFTTAYLAYGQIQDNIKNEFLEYNDSVELDNSWEIWNGTIKENIFAELSPEGWDFLSELGLKEELKTYNKDADILLTFLGQNVSQGQKTKILIIRALHIAIYEKKPLKININLHSLDPLSCKKLFVLFNKISEICTINISEEQKDFIENQINRSNAYELDHEIYTSSIEKINKDDFKKPSNQPRFIQYFLKLLPIYSLCFLVPAILLNVSAYLTKSNFLPILKIEYITLIVISSIPLSLLFGYLIENTIRLQAKKFQENLISYAKIGDLNDLIQRISKDFLILLERISWYIHDISWYQALIIVSMLSISYTFGYEGILVNLTFIIAIAVLCLIYAKPMAETRIQAINGINKASNIIVNISAVSIFYNEAVTNLRKHWINSGFNELSITHIKMINTKATFSNLIILVMGIYIIAITILFAAFDVKNNVIIFVMNSLFAMQSIIINFFQALIGLNAQINSYERLEFPETESKLIDKLVLKQSNYYLLQECAHPYLNINYKECQLQIGNCYSLSGPSGYGKTEYLKTISGFYFSSLEKAPSNKVLYLSKNSLEILNWLDIKDLKIFIKDKILKEKYELIILDESLANFSIKDLKATISLLSETLVNSASSLILVDHRLELDNNISVTNLINKL